MTLTTEDGVLATFVDLLMPALRPYEVTLYLYLLRKTYLVGHQQVRVGQRTMGKECGLGTRSVKGVNQQHLRGVLASLQEKGCIQIGDTTREGTLYFVVPPDQTPVARSVLAVPPISAELDYFQDAALRTQLFERDGWRCHYCQDLVTPENVTLDHIRATSTGGTNEVSNLVTACLQCNSIKGARSYDEAAPDLLRAITQRRRS